MYGSFVYQVQIGLKLFFMCMRISMESTYASRHRQVRLHSSFVVFYFVFVL